MSEQGNISVEKKGRVLCIGLDRSEKKNALTVKMYEEMSLAFTRLQEEDDLRCGLLFAHGETFTAGLDLPQWAASFASGKLPAPDHAVCPFRTRAPYLTKPVVTAVQGLCLTAGIELMLATDIRVAAKNARFGQIEVKRGIYPVGGATIRFVQNIGWGNAMRYLLTGDEFSAEDAYRMGMVQELTEPGQEFDKALEIANTICEQAPLGVQASLISARRALLEGELAAMDQLLPDLQPILKSEDVQEGMMSFIERRKAQFKGK